MLNAIRAIVKEGKIELLEEIDIPEGTEVLVTPLIDETDFWLKASRPTIDTVWDNEDDNVYAELSQGSLVVKPVGQLSPKDGAALEKSLRDWLGLH